MEKSQTFELTFEKLLEARPKIVHNAKRLLKSTLNSVFSGKDLIDWLIEHYNPTHRTRSELVEKVKTDIFNINHPFQFFYPATPGHPFEDKKDCYFRFTEDHYKEQKRDPDVLNMNGVDISPFRFFYQTDESETSEEVSLEETFGEIHQTLEEIIIQITHHDRFCLDYQLMADNDIINEKVVPIVVKLAFLDITELNKDERAHKSFFLNVYNVLHLHAMQARFYKKKNWNINLVERFEFYTKYRYNIGGQLYSLHDIEHGILRKNNAMGENAVSTIANYVFSMKSPNSRFKETDPRIKFIVEKVDPRIHFATHVAAMDSPSLRVFDPENVEEQLEEAAKDYVKKTVFVKSEKGKTIFELCEVYKFYRVEFGITDNGLLEYIDKYLDEESPVKLNFASEVQAKNKLHIKFKAFNWSVNFKKKAEQKVADNEESKENDEAGPSDLGNQGLDIYAEMSGQNKESDEDKRERKASNLDEDDSATTDN